MTQLWRAFGSVVPVFLVIVVVVVVIAYIIYRVKRMDSGMVIGSSLLVLSVIAILLVTLGTGTYDREAEPVLNVVPIIGTVEMIINDVRALKLVRNIFLNILLFMPFGFLLRMCVGRRKMTRSRIVLVGFLLSLSIEVIQYVLLTGRWADEDDVILNTLGAFLGCVLCERLLGFPQVTRNQGRRSNNEKIRRSL